MKLLHRNRRPSKRGSSLPMVMAIGAALVIWVMALLPLMATSGTTAAQTKLLEANYLSSKSSIEFVKGELTDMVKSGVPKSFAVVESGGEYMSVPKYDVSGNPDSAYTSLVDTSANVNNKKDSLDVPKSDSVVALCSVEHTPGSSVYDITIKTYNGGEAGMTYTATYTLAGNLKIFPEAYKQVDALPLSDFVLVDGKLGNRTVWTSTIKQEGSSGFSPTNFKEYLLPEPVEGAEGADANYANAGEYPAIFKKTAETITKDDENDLIIPDDAKALEDPKPQNWILPTASDFVFDNATKTVAISANSALSKLTMAELKCTVYYNGVPAKAAPTGTGTYRVTISVMGTGIYDEGDDVINVLPANGIDLGSYTINAQNASYGNSNVSINRSAPSATFYKDSNVTSPVEFYYRENGGELISATAGETIQLDESKVYTFYVRANGYQDDDGIIYQPTKLQYLNAYAKSGPVSDLSAGSEYLLLMKVPDQVEDPNSDTCFYYVLDRESNSVEISKIELPKSLDNLSTSQVNGYSRWIYNIEDITYTYRDNRGKQQTATEEDAEVLKSGNSNKPYLSLRDSSHSSVSVAGNNEQSVILKITNDGDRFRITRSNKYLSVKEETYRDWWGNETITYRPVLSSSTADWFFVKVGGFSSNASCEVPSLSLSGADGTYGAVSPKTIADSLGYEISSLYLNGNECASTDTTVLPAGKYTVHVHTDGFRFVPVGTVTVSPQSFSLSGTVAVVESLYADPPVPVNPITNYTANLSYTAWSDTVPSLHYYGFIGSDNKTHWFDSPSIGNLSPGKYTFVVMQGNTNNYICSGTVSSGSSKIEVVHPDWTAGSGVEKQFVYTVDEEGNVSWYHLPADLAYPSRVTLCSKVTKKVWRWVDWYIGGYYDKIDVDFWHVGYYDNAVEYGVIVDVSDYYVKDNDYEEGDETDDNVLVISGPGHQEVIDDAYNSVITGRSLYFMGDGYSIDTNGADVKVTTDLLVLRNGIDGIRYNDEESRNNAVTVMPYTNNTSRTDYTLLFVVNGFSTSQATFENRTFYMVKEGTDLTGTPIATEGAADPAIRKIGAINDGALPPEVREYFVYDEYPVLIADVAYANTDQLSRVLSGETMGWTKKGDLGAGTGAQYSSTSSSTFNVEYAVCAYVTSISKTVDYSANRIMIATPGSDYKLSVTSNITMRTRYLSIDAATMTGTRFIVNVLEEADGVLEKLMDKVLGSNYNSKTLQVEFERDTVMPAKTMQANTYRYANGSNLFTDPTANAGDLVEEFKVDNVNYTLSHSIASYLTNVDIQERYIRFAKDGGSDTLKMDASFLGLTQSSLCVYTNFLEFKDVTTVYIGSSNNIKLNTQEKGYDDTEYLGIFKDSSAESYHGVMLHCKNPVTVTKGSTSVTIPKGMYFVKSAECGNFVTIAQKIAADEAAADAAHANGQPYTYQYRVDAEWLAENAAYIDVDGVIQNAYVDSDILGGGAGSAQTGFAGGSLQ